MSVQKNPAVRLRLDWNAVRERLGQSEQALSEASVLSRERTDAILRRRAEALAKRGLEKRNRTRSESRLVFTLNAERYALATQAIVEISKLEQCAPVPGVPPEVLGIVSHRGELRAIIDLAALLGLKTEGDRRAGFVLFLRRAECQAGFRVDAVEEVSSIDAATVQIGGDTGAARFSTGVTRDGLILLNAETLLAHEILGAANRPLSLSSTRP